VRVAVAPQVIFRNVHKLLVDTASSEFLFCLDFWEEEAAFRELFAPVVAVVEGDLNEQLQVCAVMWGCGLWCVCVWGGEVGGRAACCIWPVGSGTVETCRSISNGREQLQVCRIVTVLLHENLTLLFVVSCCAAALLPEPA
jgi:hypothetical protein